MHPLSLATPVSPSGQLPRPKSDSRKSILVVDDDAAMRMLLERYLTAFGYRPLLAGGGDEALSIARMAPDVCVVILDLVMPGISGRSLSEQLTVLLPKATILFCSGHPASALIHLGMDIAGAQFLQKPCRPLDLKQRLSEILVLR
jgi:DNA-binding response OmpR family regulator